MSRTAAILALALVWAASPAARAGCPPSGYSLANELIVGIYSDPNQDEVVFAVRAATTDDGKPVLYKSCDAGQSWSPTALTAKFHRELRSIAIDPTDSDNIIARDGANGLLRSRDGGVTWSVEEAPGTGYVLFTVDGSAYAWSSGTSARLLRLGAHDTSWQFMTVPPGSAQVMRAHPTDPNRLHTGAAYSIDGGTSWQALAATGPMDIKYSRSDPIRMIRTGLPVSLSGDGGLTWQEPVLEEFGTFGYGDLPGRIVAFDNQDPNTLWVALDRCGLWRSRDGGFSWSTADKGITGSPDDRCPIGWLGRDDPADIMALELSPVDADRIYASTDQGVFTSSDGGESWQDANGVAAANPPEPPPGPFSGSADLSLQFYGVPSKFDPPTTVRFHALVTNHGPDPAQQSRFSWGSSRVVSTSVGDCDANGCYFDTLAPGATVDLAIEMRILGGGIGTPCNGDVYTVWASVSALTDDSDPQNNQAGASMTRTGNAPLISSCPGEGIGGGGAADPASLLCLLLVSALTCRKRERHF
jgi:photosystem II stability/assembly factor-like uncharacterized protein